MAQGDPNYVPLNQIGAIFQQAGTSTPFIVTGFNNNTGLAQVQAISDAEARKFGFATRPELQGTQIQASTTGFETGAGFIGQTGKFSGAYTPFDVSTLGGITPFGLGGVAPPSESLSTQPQSNSTINNNINMATQNQVAETAETAGGNTLSETGGFTKKGNDVFGPDGQPVSQAEFQKLELNFALIPEPKDFSGFFATPTGSIGPKGQKIMDVFKNDGTKIEGSQAEALGLTDEVIAGLRKDVAPTGFVSQFDPIATGSSPDGQQDISVPDPTANQSNENSMLSLQGEVDRLKEERDTIQADKKKQIDADLAELKKEQDKILADAKPLTEAFREELRKKELEQLHWTENFEKKQGYIAKLETLLTEGNALVDQMRGVTGLASIRNPRINQAINAVNAEVGVINAVLKVIDGQLNSAERMIDSTIADITADRKDQLAYYNTLLRLNENETIKLEAKETKFLDAQIAVIEDDLANAEAKADYIKSLLVDPATADMMARYNITINDTPEEVNRKMADGTYKDNVREQHIKMREDGWEWVPTPDLLANIPANEIVKITDSRGQVHQYRDTNTGDFSTRRIGGFEILFDEKGERVTQRVIPKGSGVPPKNEPLGTLQEMLAEAKERQGGRVLSHSEVQDVVNDRNKKLDKQRIVDDGEDLKRLSITAKQEGVLVARGIPRNIVLDIERAFIVGTDIEVVRQALLNDKVDSSWVDIFVSVVDIEKLRDSAGQDGGTSGGSMTDEEFFEALDKIGESK